MTPPPKSVCKTKPSRSRLKPTWGAARCFYRQSPADLGSKGLTDQHIVTLCSKWPLDVSIVANRCKLYHYKFYAVTIRNQAAVIGYAHAYNVILVCVLFTNIDRGYRSNIIYSRRLYTFFRLSCFTGLCTSFRALVWHACVDLFVRNFLVLACLSNLVVPSVVEQYGGGACSLLLDEIIIIIII